MATTLAPAGVVLACANADALFRVLALDRAAMPPLPEPVHKIRASDVALPKTPTERPFAQAKFVRLRHPLIPC
jgi:hypothetical protein